MWTALRIPALWDHHAGMVSLAPEILPIVCFCVLALAPRRRAADPRRLAWLNLGIAVVVINHDRTFMPRLFLAAAPMVLAIAIT